jgi:hypothetical protein
MRTRGRVRPWRAVYGFAPRWANPATVAAGEAPAANGVPAPRRGHSTSRAKADRSEATMRAHLTTSHGGAAKETEHHWLTIALAILVLLALAVLLVVAAPESAGAFVAGLLPSL